jgi:hypothetical protein
VDEIGDVTSPNNSERCSQALADDSERSRSATGCPNCRADSAGYSGVGRSAWCRGEADDASSTRARTHADLLPQLVWVLRKDGHAAAIDLRAVPGVGAEGVLTMDGELRRTRL